MADPYAVKVQRITDILDAGDPKLSNENLARRILAAVDNVESLVQRVQGRPARFCSTKCRNQWHANNRTTTAVRISTDIAARVNEIADDLVVSPRLVVEHALTQYFEMVDAQ